MKSRAFSVTSLPMRRPQSHRGDSAAALLITLACITILSGLVIAYLAHSLVEMQISTASAGQTSAVLFARGSVDAVIGELQQEITAGSIAYAPSGSDLRDPATLFLPVTNTTMVPSRMDLNAPLNVLKRSAYNVPFYTNGAPYNTSWPPPNWAANFSTTDPGTTGRAISLARWNEPLLMPTASSTSTNLTPTNSFIPPDWIYMSRTAGPVTNWSSALVSNTVAGALNTNCVVGRYAYVVYDEGGLLDANAAGYPSSVTASMVRHKISEACADLTQIGLSSTDIAALVAWRNPNNGANAVTYTNYIYNAATNAFLTPAAGERLFTSRQQLIAFLTQNVAQNAADVERMEAALPFLTHFSRELNAPSWYPQTNLAGVYTYYKNATNVPPTATNIFAPLAPAVTSYTNSSGLVILPKQSVAFSRFPLSRLAWLGSNGPAGGATPTQIQQSFGLVWDGANYAWEYVGPTGSTVQNSIALLANISGREPNFFELLKAGILSGSVGMVPTVQVGTFPNFGGIDTRYNMASVGAAYNNIDPHLMEIGLAMIDQASSATLPTRIEFGANTGTSALYGNKNLPYLYRMVYSPYRPATEPLEGTNRVMFDAWAEPVFWNPYQTVTTNTGSLQIRLRADGVYNATVGQFGAKILAETATLDQRTCLPEVQCGPAGANTQTGGGNGSSIELDSASAAAFSSETANPAILSSLLTNGITPVFNDLRAQNPVGWSIGNADLYTEVNNGVSVTYAGFWLGHIYAPNPPAPDADYTTNSPPTGIPFYTSFFYSNTQQTKTEIHQFVLEANYGGGTFLEVQRMPFNYNGGLYVEEGDDFMTLQRRLNFMTFNDPRTGRFSWDLMQPKDYSNDATPVAPLTALDLASPTWTTFMSGTTNFSALISRVPVTSASITLTPSGGANINPTTVDTFRFADNMAASGTATTPNYKDTDGAQRPADGWWSSSSANTLPMQNYQPDRPVLLNRSFYSVGELGYAFRDMPWRSLNFSSSNSPDAGLLDFFSVNDGYAGVTNQPVVGGRIDLNTPHPEVLAAMLNGAARAQLYSAYDVSSSDAASMAKAITNLTTTLPLLNKSEIATRLAPNDPTVVTNATSEPGIDTNIKERREVIVRALASAGQVRTWNLLIDVIAQTGHLPPNATGFNNFLITAEQHYWAHVAIDRYTGQVISLQLEPVSE